MDRYSKGEGGIVGYRRNKIMIITGISAISISVQSITRLGGYGVSTLAAGYCVRRHWDTVGFRGRSNMSGVKSTRVDTL